MNDIEEMVGSLLAGPDPSPQVTERGRQRLRDAMHRDAMHRPGHRRVGWLAGGLGLAAASTAGILAIASATPRAGVARDSLGAQRILLAAAGAAATTPQSSGTYWYLKVSDSGGSSGKHVQVTWTKRDGESWVLAPDGKGVYSMSGPGEWAIGEFALTFAQLQHLPTTSDGLRAPIVRSLSHPSGDVVPVLKRPITAADIRDTLVSDTLDLLEYVPIPRGVRAAAFRLLASLPGVKDLGPIAGGERLSISVGSPPASKFASGKVPAGADEIVITVDTSTASLRSSTTFQGTETILGYGWTNTMPKVIDAPSGTKG